MSNNLAGPARAAGGHQPIHRDIAQTTRGFGDQDIYWIVPRQCRSQLKSPWQFSGQIFQGVHRDIDLLTQQSLFKLFGEQSLVNLWSRMAEADIEPPIPSRPDDSDFNFGCGRQLFERFSDQFNLRHSQSAAARAENDPLHVRRHSIAAGAIPPSATRLNQVSKSWTCFSIKPSEASASFFRVSRVRSAID